MYAFVLEYGGSFSVFKTDAAKAEKEEGEPNTDETNKESKLDKVEGRTEVSAAEGAGSVKDSDWKITVDSIPQNNLMFSPCTCLQ